ncbi:MAG: hypothetical protein ABR608_05500 [Pseudonocardiaceae bacterium]
MTIWPSVGPATVPIALTTLRADSNAVAMFCAYVTHPAYGWSEFCERTSGDVPVQICFEWNTPRHTTDDAVRPGRRAFTKLELQRLFDYLDDLVDRDFAAGSKPRFRPEPARVPAYGSFGAVTVR